MPTLKEVFTDIANAIREKTSKSAKITPLDMASEISTISGGGGANENTYLSFLNENFIFAGGAGREYSLRLEKIFYTDGTYDKFYGVHYPSYHLIGDSGNKGGGSSFTVPIQKGKKIKEIDFYGGTTSGQWVSGGSMTIDNGIIKQTFNLHDGHNYMDVEQFDLGTKYNFITISGSFTTDLD